MQTDRELIILQSSGFSILQLIKPVVFFGFLLTLVSFFFTLYLSPKSNQNFKILLYSIKNDYSATLLQDGIFTTIGKDFTIFIRERDSKGDLNNIFIHDSRDAEKPSTLIAKKGRLIRSNFSTKILLEEGSQQFQSQDKKLSILYFDKYLLDVNQSEGSSLINRWKSPSERSLDELQKPDMDLGDDLNNLQSFKAEITLRFALPLNILFFGLFILTFLFSLKFYRVENYKQTIKVFSIIIGLEILTIISSNLSIKIQNMQYLNFLPILFSIIAITFFISSTKKLA